MRKSLIFLFIFIIYACPPCDREIIENGPLPQSALDCVPYQDGEIYKLKYSEDLIINFTAERRTEENWQESRGQWCGPETHYEENNTVLKADYPLFDIGFEMNNYDTTRIYCHAYIGNSGYYIPIPDSQHQVSYSEKFDSMFFDGNTYKDVYIMTSASSNDATSSGDSLYYNYEFGILKYIRSNGETYTITQ